MKKEKKDLIKKFDVDIIAVGNGTASRESEKLEAEDVSEYNDKKVSNIVAQINEFIKLLFVL